MKARLIVSLLLIFVLMVNVATLPAQSGVGVPVIIKLLPGKLLSPVLALLGGTLVDTLPGANTYLLRLPSVPIVTPLLKLLLGLVWAEPNTGLGMLPVDVDGLLTPPATASPQWYRSQPSMQLIQVAAAQHYSTGRGVIIADINSQIDYSHPALMGHLTTGYDFVANKAAGTADLNQSTAGFLDDDQSTAGFLDDQSTAGFLDAAGIGLNQSTAGFLDGTNPAYSHGTLCAGIIAAVAPDAMIMPLRAFDDNGNADAFTLAKAIRYAADHGAHVINMSFGTLTNANVLREAIEYARQKNVVLVASAGNNNTSAPQYPAAYPGVLGTAATNIFDIKAGFSNYGVNVLVDAPGTNIMSAYPGGKYAMTSGTSFSAPLLAGSAALVRSLQATGVTSRLTQGTINIDSRNPLYYGKLGYGRIDVLKAVQPQ